jgi:hypothetical protein
LSDLDLFFAFDDRAEAEIAHVEVWLAGLGELTRAREDAYNAPEGGRYFEAVYPAEPVPIVVDSYWQPVSCSTLGGDTRVVFDKVGYAEPSPAGPPMS